MAEDLTELHTLASSMLELLEPGQRRKYLRQMAGDIRKVNQARMARQVAPDGTPWEARRPRRRQKTATRPVRFLYPSGGVGEPRLVDMRSWVGRGDMVIGFDREADGLRTFRKDRILRWITEAGSAEGGEIPTTPRKARAAAMFRGLRSSKYLKQGVGEEEAWIEFAGKAARLARVHHYGLRDRVTPGGPIADYPARPLIGFAPSDEARILNRFIDHVGDSLGWGRRSGH